MDKKGKIGNINQRQTYYENTGTNRGGPGIYILPAGRVVDFEPGCLGLKRGRFVDSDRILLCGQSIFCGPDALDSGREVFTARGEMNARPTLKPGKHSTPKGRLYSN